VELSLISTAELAPLEEQRVEAESQSSFEYWSEVEVSEAEVKKEYY
jgi:hypothetical protein